MYTQLRRKVLSARDVIYKPVSSIAVSSIAIVSRGQIPYLVSGKRSMEAEKCTFAIPLRKSRRAEMKSRRARNKKTVCVLA
jgi:hypothetical protein